MKYLQNFRKQFLHIFVIVLVMFAFVACGKKNEFQVISSIDPASVTEQDGIVHFTAVRDDGMTLRFEGIGITVEEDAIVFEPGAKLFSLDYVGKVMEIIPSCEEKGCMIDFGFSYANSSSVESMTELCTGFLRETGLYKKKDVIDVSDCDADFLAMAMSENNSQSYRIRELTIVFDTTVPQIFLSELDPMGEKAELIKGYAIDWMNGGVGFGMSEEQLALKKMENPNVLRSDLVTGIDHNSIVTEGNSTFFSVTMSNGEVVRFEGENIAIEDSGIVINPGSEVTSLDAIGKIYGYYPKVENREQYEEEDFFGVGYGYTYSSAKTGVERAEDVHTWGICGVSVVDLGGENLLSVAAYEPNFVYVSGSSYNVGSCVLSNLEVCYDPTEKVTGVRDAKLNIEFSGSYLEGERYDASREQGANLEANDLRFYLILEPDTEGGNLDVAYRSILYVPAKFFKVGALRDSSGKELDKKNALLSKGCTLDLTVGDFEVKMPLETVERYEGAQTMNDLVPYAYPAALGEINTLVVPVIWADQTDMANEDTLQFFREGIGRIVDENGNVTDYSDTTDDKLSLSEYFDISSYGKMKINSFMTDWYYATENFADVYQMAPDENYSNGIMDWVKTNYPEMDFSKYDKDANGYVDYMVILNAGVRDSDSVSIISYEGAINYRATYFGDLAGTQEAPRVNSYTTVGYRWIQDDYSTIIHEFSHGLGLIDYYDVNYSGIDAVGGFDMQSGSLGDWNAYSKLAVGWMEPKIVEGLTSGQSVEYTIGAMALTDDVIIIPAAGKTYDGPFGEYVMIDLFADEGVNTYYIDTQKYGDGLKDAVGVRISHVNANMEKRTEKVNSVYNQSQNNEYTIGTIHIANNFQNDPMGRYNIEVIQAGGDNTFTDISNLDTTLRSDDLFYAGDKFDVANYQEFFYEGLMDDGSVFGYTVEIVSIGKDADGNPAATIRVTAN